MLDGDPSPDYEAYLEFSTFLSRFRWWRRVHIPDNQARLSHEWRKLFYTALQRCLQVRMHYHDLSASLTKLTFAPRI